MFVYYSKYMSAAQSNKPARYYHIHIHDALRERFFRSNSERALVITSLQRYLGTRSLVQFPYREPALAKYIDLLAFSLHENGIELVAFALSRNALQTLCSYIIAELREFRLEYAQQAPMSSIMYSRTALRGSHHALEITRYVHLLHLDWENDRYSSIGFYLHDRRGDWMRLWRMARLYDNNSDQYRSYLLAGLHSLVSTAVRDSLKHA